MTPKIRTQWQKYSLAKWKMPYKYAASINVSLFWGTDKGNQAFDTCLLSSSAEKSLTAPVEQGLQHIGGRDDQESLKSKGRSTKEGVGQKHEELWEWKLYTPQIIASAERTREHIKVSGTTLFREFPMALKTHMANRVSKKDRVHGFCYGPSYGLGPCVRE